MKGAGWVLRDWRGTYGELVSYIPPPYRGVLCSLPLHWSRSCSKSCLASMLRCIGMVNPDLPGEVVLASSRPVINRDTGYTAMYGGVLLVLAHASSFSSTHSICGLSCLLVVTVIWTFCSGGVSGFDLSLYSAAMPTVHTCLLFTPLGPDHPWCASGNALTDTARVSPLGGTPYSVTCSLLRGAKSFQENLSDVIPQGHS